MTDNAKKAQKKAAKEAGKGFKDSFKDTVRSVKSAGKTLLNAIGTTIAHPIRSVKEIASAIRKKAKEKGESYVGGYILGEVTQTVAAAGAAAAAGKGLKGAKAVDKGGDIAKTLNAVRKPLAKNEGKQFKAAAKGIKKITKGKADKAVEIAKGGKKEHLCKVDDIETGFKYMHNPSDNPKALGDAIRNPKAVYGYSPNPKSKSISGYADAIDWSSPKEVAKATARREKYHIRNDNILEQVIKMRAEGYSAEEIARKTNQLRNTNRLNDYISDPEGLARVKNRNLLKYGNEDGPTAEYLFEKYGSWEKVIEKSMSANPGMDACCGLYDKYYHLYEFN